MILFVHVTLFLSSCSVFHKNKRVIAHEIGNTRRSECFPWSAAIHILNGRSQVETLKPSFPNGYGIDVWCVRQMARYAIEV
jgi:hypothetical protein